MKTPPDLLVERLALGELSDEEVAEARERWGDQLEARLEALARDDERIRAELPATEVAAEVRRRLSSESSSKASARERPIRWWIPMTTAMAAAALVGVLWLGGSPSDGVLESSGTQAESWAPETTRIKGEPRLWVERIIEAQPERLKAGSAVAAGERLQVHYHAGGAEQGVIVSIDGAAATTLHFPDDETLAPTLDTGGPVTLGHSYELDDAPSFERFFFVTAEEGGIVDVAVVLDAARALATGDDAERGHLVLPSGYEQTSLLLKKK